ncbi:MAG: restriction endonuclease subunit S [Bacteroidia bacterium]|nr:restriction endonuclease subunit S [Bacteroidia bacterium]
MELVEQKRKWKWIKLGQAANVLDNLRRPINAAEREKRILGKDESLLYPYYGATGQVGYIDSYLTDGEYILVGEDGAPFLDNFKSKAYKIKGKGWVNNHAHILQEVESITINDFILYYLNSINYRPYVNGTTRLKLTKGSLVEIPFPIPSIAEQHLIVSKIESLFSELDKAVESLKTAQQQLKTYRQSVLKWAFEGRLTNENVKEGELPEGWDMKTLSQIGTWKGGGTPSKSRKEFWEKGSIMWVSPKDMKSKVITDTIDRITNEAIQESSAKLIDSGSILFVVRSGILRRTLPVGLTTMEVTVNQDLQALTPAHVLPDYVYWYVVGKNEDIRRDCSKDGTTVESIESVKLRNYKIPICTDNEQKLIVQEIESRLSVADKMEASITESLQQAEALRQSILKRAFEGKLV